MPVAILICLCGANLATSLGGTVALKYAIATQNVVWALVAALCWVGTALVMALLLAERPMIWVALITQSLTLIGAMALATLVFAEPVSKAHVAALIFALLAFICASLANG